jgi:hypothetical protein
MGIRAKSLTTMLFLVLIAALSYGQEFSADVVYLDSNGKPSPSHPVSKIYVTKNKFRLETNGFTGNVLLVDRDDPASFVLQPKKKTYQTLASGPSEYFHTENPDDACATWQSAADQQVLCEKVDTETVNGREAVKYKNKAATEMSASAVWIDKALKFVIKWQSADTEAELRNIKEEKQAAELFNVPPDYKAASPQKGSKGFSHK